MEGTKSGWDGDGDGNDNENGNGNVKLRLNVIYGQIIDTISV